MKIFYYSFGAFLTVLLVCACASSDVSRNVSSNIQLGVENAKGLTSGADSSDLAAAYQNSSQSTKGALIGGAAGALTGAVSSGIGILPGTAAGAIFGASYGSYIDAHSSLTDQLINRGVNIITLGDQVIIILPSYIIFYPLTANIKPHSYSTLQLVTHYINQFTKILVKISVFTNCTQPPEISLALSQQQAKSIAKFLTESGVDARILYAAGYGGTHLVEKNSNNWEGSDNYRIEISLEKAYL